MSGKRQIDTALGEPLQLVDLVYVRFRGRKLLCFAGCDYFRLSCNPTIKSALCDGLARYGLSTAASRRTTGNHLLYQQLEGAIARYFKVESAVFVSSGYLANVAVAHALAGDSSHAFVDEFSHSSLLESIKPSIKRIIPFRHRDPGDLKRKLARVNSNGKILVITDGMFAYDGTVAPIGSYSAVLPAKSILWVDEAHAAGVLGPGGRGSVALADVPPRNVIQTMTFSKAFGVYGGAVLCEAKYRSKILSRSAVITGNTPLPLPLASAALAALRLLKQDASFRERLAQNIERFWDVLGRAAPEAASPIIAVEALEPEALKQILLRNGIYPPFIRYPGGPEQGYFRFALSSEHTPRQIARLAEVLRPNIPLITTAT